jgi:deoxyribonuclease V
VIAIVDVFYEGDRARAAAVIARAWTDEVAIRERVVEVATPAEYVSGELYRRELPPILAVLDDLEVDAVCVDGHAWLGADRPGLGAHLHRALGVPVVGIAKSEFVGAPAIAVTRGASTNPLWVSAAGMDAADAARAVVAMHGPHRLPTLVVRADQLSRALVTPSGSRPTG